MQREKLGEKVIIHLMHIQSDRYCPFICVLLKHFKISSDHSILAEFAMEKKCVLLCKKA